MTARLVLLSGALALCGCQALVATPIGARVVAGRGRRARRGAAIDLRDPAEYEAGHLPGAVNVLVLGLDGYLSRAPARHARPLLLVYAPRRALGADGAASPRRRPHARGREGWRPEFGPADRDARRCRTICIA